MDQNKTMLPHAGPNGCKSMNGMFKMKTHVMGVISHGTRDVCGFFDLCQFGHGSNLTVNVLLNVLSRYALLPPVLYLQLDNCGGDNKNRYLLALCCLLVEMGILKKIKLGFLMVGHTHEDIDQCFSCFSRWLDKHRAYTLEDMMEGFEKCYTPRPTSILLEDIFDFKSWITPHLNDLTGHQDPHQFRISRDENGKAFIATKSWCTDPEWTYSIGSCNGVLVKDIPPGVPLIAPRTTNPLELVRFKKGLESLTKTLTIDINSWTRILETLSSEQGERSFC